jgi:hypothetical protein
MKKSASIVLGLSITLSACYSDRRPPVPANSTTSTNTKNGDWTYGNDAPDSKDTVVNGNHYRRHYGLYYPIIAGMIAPRLYQGGNMSQISSPSYRPVNRNGVGGRGSSANSTPNSATTRGGFGAKSGGAAGRSAS